MLAHLFKCRNAGLCPILRESDRARRSSSRSGFSLIEVTITLVIMGIIAAIAIPRFSESDRRYRVDAAVKRLLDDVKLARQLARARGASQTIEFTRSGYRISTLESKDRGKSARYAVELDSPPYNVLISSLSASGNAIQINAFGDIANTAELTMQVGSYARKVRIGTDGIANITVATPLVTVEADLIGKGGVVGVEVK